MKIILTKHWRFPVLCAALCGAVAACSDDDSPAGRDADLSVEVKRDAGPDVGARRDVGPGKDVAADSLNDAEATDADSGDAVGLGDGAATDALLADAQLADSGAMDGSADGSSAADGGLDASVSDVGTDVLGPDVGVEPTGGALGTSCTKDSNCDTASGLACLLPTATRPNGICSRVCAASAECVGAPEGTRPACLFNVTSAGVTTKWCGLLCLNGTTTYPCPGAEQRCVSANATLSYCYPPLPPPS